MASLLVQAPDMGLNGLLPENMRDPREAGDNIQNLLYEYGLMKTPFGFAKLNLTSGLNSGDTVLSVFPFTELDKTTHVVAVTTEKLYDHDRINKKWNPKTQSGVTMASDIYHPVSYAEVGHNDAGEGDDNDIYIDDDSGKDRAYHHLVVCDGGLSNIQRWAGKYEADFADMLGGDGYHKGTTHRALQVSMSQKNRLLLLSPREYDSASNQWIQNNQRIRWPTIGKLETWTGTGSSFADLMDTGGRNVWSAQLAEQHIIYQTKGIWTLNWVGGTTVFEPYPIISDLGLLSWHLLITYNNVHYFVGTDYNVYAYYGGTVKRAIGDKIQKYLEDDFKPETEYRAWMSMDIGGKRLWIFVAPEGSSYITKAYGMDMRTKSWMPRDLSNKWPTGGVTAVNLIGTESYTIGNTYAEALDSISIYQADVSKDTVADVTERYGDLVEDGTINVLDWSAVDETLDFTQVDFSTAGLFFCFTTKTGDVTEIVGDDTDYSNMNVRIDDGSDSNNMAYGSHFYTMTDISIKTDVAGVSAKVNLAPRDSTSAATTATGFAAADNSSNIPAINAVGADCSATIYDSSGTTYRQKSEEVRTQPRMMFGDSNGFVYQFDEDLETDDRVAIDSQHITPIFDWQQPDIYKRWPGIAVTGKGTAVVIEYRTSEFDSTSDDSWTEIS